MARKFLSMCPWPRSTILSIRFKIWAKVELIKGKKVWILDRLSSNLVTTSKPTITPSQNGDLQQRNLILAKKLVFMMKTPETDLVPWVDINPPKIRRKLPISPSARTDSKPQTNSSPYRGKPWSQWQLRAVAIYRPLIKIKGNSTLLEKLRPDQPLSIWEITWLAMFHRLDLWANTR